MGKIFEKGTSIINSIDFFIAEKYLPKYQENSVISKLSRDIMYLLKSIYFSEEHNFSVNTESSDKGISGYITLEDHEEIDERDITIRRVLLNQIKTKLETKYPEIQFYIPI